MATTEKYVTTIEKGNDIFTLINVFTVAPENQDRLVDLLVQATTETMQHLPGFISASIHKSYDGSRVVNYAQWRSKEDFEAMRSNPEAVPHMKAAAALGEFDPIGCVVAESISVPAVPAVSARW
jgi:quinol monooxygenase YgiN